MQDVTLIDRGKVVGGSGDGLPTTTISYQEWLQMSDADQLNYTGYIIDYPGGGGGGGDTTIRYDEETDYVQVLYNNVWTNWKRANMNVDPTKMTFSQEEFISICNAGLQSQMTIGAIIILNNEFCRQYEVIDVDHDSTTGTVDIMAHRQIYNMKAGSSGHDYNTSDMRSFINNDFFESFDSDIMQLAKTMNVTTLGTTNQDKVKLLSWKELGVTYNSSIMYNTDGGTQYPCFTAGAYNTDILDRWRGTGILISNTGKYWTRSATSADGNNYFSVTSTGALTYYTKGTTDTLGILPVLRF